MALGDTYGTIDHLQDLVLDSVQILGVSGWCAADNIIDFDIVVFSTHSACTKVSKLVPDSAATAILTSIHSIGELDEDRVLLHNALDVLTTNTDDAFVVLIRHMERNRCRHFLLHKSEALLHGLISCCHDIDVEIVLIETIENDLHIALSHYLVDFAVLFATDEFLVLIGKLNLDANLVLRLRNELHL